MTVRRNEVKEGRKNIIMDGLFGCSDMAIYYTQANGQRVVYHRYTELKLDDAIADPEKAIKKFVYSLIKDCLQSNKKDIKVGTYIEVYQHMGYLIYDEDFSEDPHTELKRINHRVQHDEINARARVKSRHGKLYLDGWEFNCPKIYYRAKEVYKTHRDWKVLGIEKFSDEELRLKNLAEKNFEIFCKTGEVIPVR